MAFVGVPIHFDKCHRVVIGRVFGAQRVDDTFLTFACAAPCGGVVDEDGFAFIQRGFDHPGGVVDEISGEGCER